MKFRLFLWDRVQNCCRLLNTNYSWKLYVDTYISTPLLTTAFSKLVHAPQCFTQFFEQTFNWSPCFHFAPWNLYTAGKAILFKFKSDNVTPLLTILHWISITSVVLTIQQLLCFCGSHWFSHCISHCLSCLLRLP